MAVPEMQQQYNRLQLTLTLARLAPALGVIAVLLSVAACHRQDSAFTMLRADHDVMPGSKYPVAIEPTRVGNYPSETKSGAGYFYDDVLEYRVWLHPENGAAHANRGNDYFVAFAQYEKAEAFSKNTSGAEEPLVLVRQREWIDEPQLGLYRHEKGERITEWKVQWLLGGKRTATSIPDFLAHPRPAQEE